MPLVRFEPRLLSILIDWLVLVYNIKVQTFTERLHSTEVEDLSIKAMGSSFEGFFSLLRYVPLFMTKITPYWQNLVKLVFAVFPP